MYYSLRLGDILIYVILYLKFKKIIIFINVYEYLGKYKFCYLFYRNQGIYCLVILSMGCLIFLFFY